LKSADAGPAKERLAASDWRWPRSSRREVDERITLDDSQVLAVLDK